MKSKTALRNTTAGRYSQVLKRYKHARVSVGVESKKLRQVLGITIKDMIGHTGLTRNVINSAERGTSFSSKYLNTLVDGVIEVASHNLTQKIGTDAAIIRLLPVAWASMTPEQKNELFKAVIISKAVFERAGIDIEHDEFEGNLYFLPSFLVHNGQKYIPEITA